MTFGTRLQQLREKAGLSQSDLATKTGVPKRSIQNWEQGHRHPRWPAMLGLARALGVEVQALVKGVDE
jgi:putative transcriptional regulator